MEIPSIFPIFIIWLGASQSNLKYKRMQQTLNQFFGYSNQNDYHDGKVKLNKKSAIINLNFQKKIEKILQPKMEEYFMTNDAKKLLSGKESGHIMGTIIEEMCGDILKQNEYTITKEVNKLGEPKARAHSDFNILTKDGSTNRVNVKFSSETNGQPNICSINRMMDALRDGIIDGYYMLKVKYHRTTNETKVYFVDILDYINCLTFNGGTGQIMLKEKDFYIDYESDKVLTDLSITEKRKLIYDMYDKKLDEHIKLKTKQRMKRKTESFLF